MIFSLNERIDQPPRNPRHETRMNRLLLIKLLAGLATLTFGEVMFSSRALAECGSHVHSSAERQAGQPGSSGLPTHAPCSGPNCSARPDLPLAPIAPVVEFEQRDALQVLLQLPQSRSWSRLLLSDESPRPGLSLCIFHPPRH